MNRSEAAQALTVAAAYDNRTVGEANVMVWAEAMSDLRMADVVAAIKTHYRESADFLQPKHVRDLVRKVRSQRLEAVVLPAPPRELDDDPVAALEWQREARRLIADGEDVADVPGLVERDVVKAISGVFRSVS